MIAAARLLVAALRDPESVRALSPAAWTALLTAARAERLLGSLAYRLDPSGLPRAVAQILADARLGAEQERRAALWEADMARRALVPLGVPVVLLKGTAFVAAGLAAGQGRSIGDLDILVPRDALDAVEAALIGHGWEWVKADAYDDAYYRRWMHELPPLIHAERDRMIDVHHTILPPTAKPTPDAAALIAGSMPLENGLFVLSPADMVIHAACHLFADGDLAGGLRNLWDIDRLLVEHDSLQFRKQLTAHADRHQLRPHVARALRLTRDLYDSPVDPALAGSRRPVDALYRRRLLVRDGWGRQARGSTRFAFYIRSHAIRMPLPMLARHLLIKATRKPA